MIPQPDSLWDPDRSASGELAGGIYVEMVRRSLHAGPRALRRHLAELVASHDLTLQLQLRLSRRDPTMLVQVVYKLDVVAVKCHEQAEGFAITDLPGPCTSNEKLRFAHRLVGMGLLVVPLQLLTHGAV